jgi:dihydroorotate dehydrogenase
VYRLIRPWLFRLDAERAHELAMGLLAWTAHHPGALTLMAAALRPNSARLQVQRFGLTFPNPFGLAAGFDKDAVAVPSWAALGFGSVEVGSVTALAQAGNPRPRLFRLVDEDAVINRMGFNNLGAAATAERLRGWRNAALSVPVGVNVGKSRAASLDAARDDYAASLSTVWSLADYLVLNVSSPNTPRLRELQGATRLDDLLGLIGELRERLGTRPVLLKLAPDLDDAQLAGAASACERHGIDGLIATNTTVDRSALRGDPGQDGGLSGRPLRRRSLEVLRELRTHTSLPIVSVGGVGARGDVVARLRAGASMVQIYTAYIYRGPGLLRELAHEVLAELDREGLTSVEQLIGLDG